MSALDEDRLKNISRSIRTYIPSLKSADAAQIPNFLRLLDDVFYTSAVSSLTASHRVAAWNVLCSLIDQSLASDNEELNKAVWDQNAFKKALDLYLGHAQIARPKSTRQLMTTLTTALRGYHGQDLQQLKAAIAHRLIQCLSNYDDGSAAKASAQLLANLVQKDVVTLGDLVKSIRDSDSAGDETDLEGVQHLLEFLFQWLGKGDFGSIIASTVASFLAKLPTNGSETLSSDSRAATLVWMRPLEIAFEQGAFDMRDLRAHLFPALFKRDFTTMVSFLQSQGLKVHSANGDLSNQPSAQDTDSDLFYAALRTGKELGLIREAECDHAYCDPGLLFIPLRFIKDLAFRKSRSSRLAGLTLLIDSPIATRPFTQATLTSVKEALAVFFADVDADFRADVTSAFQRLVDRMRAITAVLARSIARSSAAEDVAPMLAYHQEFLKWSVRFLAWELRPSASYQRHISALKCLSVLVCSGLDPSITREHLMKTALGETKWNFTVATATPDIQRLLIDLLLDPFDDIRQTSSAILGYICSKPLESGKNLPYLKAAKRAEDTMFMTGRADHADGVAHLHSLCYRLSEKPEVVVFRALHEQLNTLILSAQSSLAAAVQRFPIHGVLTSIRYVFTLRKTGADDEVERQLLQYLVSIWEIVRPILCNDAPEGYLPDDMEQSSDSTKETLSYCWRALKESSLLLGAMVASLPPTQDGKSPKLAQLTDLCFTQLAELRHRGAFSTVAQTWNLCCSRSKALETSKGVPALEVYYDNVLTMLRNNVTINTRRSAGIPSLLCGLLIGDASGKLLERALSDLESISRQAVDPASAEEGSLPQVHAMNCLKDILKNSRLGEQSERYIPVALQLAADALRSDAWAIRNCGLMLFRAVIDRLLGTSDAHFDDESRTQKRISTEAHPELLDVILGLIKQPTEDSTTRYEGVFPALQLLQFTWIPNNRLLETQGAVQALTGSPSWHVRDKAARALASLQTLPEVLSDLQRLISNSVPRENGLHGALLTAKHVIIRSRNSLVIVSSRAKPQRELHEQTRQHIMDLGAVVGTLFGQCRSGATKASCLDIVRECSALLAAIEPSSFKSNSHTDLIASFDTESSLKQGPLILVLEHADSAVVRQAWARLLAQCILSQHHADSNALSAYRNLVYDLAQHDEDAVSYCLQILQSSKLRVGSPVSEMVTQLCAEITRSTAGVGLKGEAQRTLLIAGTEGFDTYHLSKKQHKEVLEETESNQQYIDQWLQLRSQRADGDLGLRESNNLSKAMISEIAAWAEDCVSAINGTGIHSREAASEALLRVRTIWTTLKNEPNLQAVFLRLCIAAYDLLNDDDEDIRLQAAAITGKILATATPTQQNTPFEPIIASQNLLAFCLSHWQESVDLASVAFSRAFGISTISSPQPMVEHLTASSSQSDTSLFAREKQNLYMDEAREARVWSQVLVRIYPSAVPERLLVEVTKWTRENLATLATYAQIKHDGPLGWSTKSNIFILGLQVAYAAEVLLKLVSKGAAIAIEPQELRKGLVDCLSAFAAEKGDVNCLWAREFERVLTASIAESHGKVSAMADRVYESAGRP